MKGFAGLTKKESDDILKQHSKVYDGYAVGNVPTNMYPISVYDDARDSAGITLTNQNVVKTYRNHRINEITAKPLNYDEIDNAYDYQSGGPQQSMIMNIYDEKPAYNFKSKGPVDVFENEPDFENTLESDEPDLEKIINNGDTLESDEPDFENTLESDEPDLEKIINNGDTLEVLFQEDITYDEKSQIGEGIMKTIDMFRRIQKF